VLAEHIDELANDFSSEQLRNHEDDRTQYVFAKDMPGHTDRFLLRARKTD
jgi:predicted methyltransferase